MSRIRRLVLTGAALVPAFTLVMASLLGWLDRFQGGKSGMTGLSPKEVLARPDDLPGREFPEGPDWNASLTVIAVTLLIAGLAVYFGSIGLDARRGSVGAFVLGWGATALSASAAEWVLRKASPDDPQVQFGLLAYNPLRNTYSFVGASAVYSYGLLFGWLTGLVLLAAFLRTRPAGHGDGEIT
ncbi:hypothetical protein [Actinomadura chokoriensis]|uniref:Uncharacterized protein n=1 Tax=Actinomadura chokoriensis TaxID=454156 RepID=A0ABV4R0K4_9ACTN